MTESVKRYVHFAAGCICLLLGAIGAVLPLLPTTVFLILAAYFFAKGSPRLRQWLLTHRTFGPPIRDWEATGAIAPRYKRLAVLMMTLTFAFSVAFGVPSYVLIIQALCLGGAATYVLSRPNA